MPSIETARDRFLDEAKKLFHLDTEEGRGPRNLHYVDIPVRIADDFSPDEGGRGAFVNSLLFLSGLSGKRIPTPDQQYALSPSVSLIVGEYGWGKTELIFQLCDHMTDSVKKPLPIRLSQCRDWIPVLDTRSPAPEAMAELLFGEIAKDAEVDASFVLDRIVPEIRDGGIVLLLDGLDELVSTTEQHRAFFTGLMNLLAAQDEDEPYFRVAVSVRHEYLSSIAPKAEDIVSLIDPESTGSVQVNFMMLVPLGDSHVKAYLSKRSEEIPNLVGIFDEVSAHTRLMEMLRRPLLLRIFCDVARDEHFNLNTFLAKLQNNQGLTALLDAFTDLAVDQLGDAQQELLPVIWKPETLATKALELARTGRRRLRLADIQDILVPAPDAQVDVRDLSPEMILKGIHKCPFLRERPAGPGRPGPAGAEFAHDVFFEYFIARGVFEAMDRDPQGNAGRQMFDELVLSVDMRKFLRGFLSEEKWRKETAYAYGLDDRGEWEPRLEDGRRGDLEAKRWSLLQSMTDPNDLPPETADTIKWLLGGDTGWLHPRYLVYTFEAVAVYLWHHRTSPHAPAVSARFGEVLQAKLKELLATAASARPKLRRPNALLIERILDIGRRVRYAWAEEFGKARANEVIDTIDREHNADIISRIEVVQEDIRNVKFPKAPG